MVVFVYLVYEFNNNNNNDKICGSICLSLSVFFSGIINTVSALSCNISAEMSKCVCGF